MLSLPLFAKHQLLSTCAISFNTVTGFGMRAFSQGKTFANSRGSTWLGRAPTAPSLLQAPRLQTLGATRNDTGARFSSGLERRLGFGRTTTLHTCAAAAASAAVPGGDGSGNSGSGKGKGGGGGLFGSHLQDVERTAEQRHKEELHTLNVAIVVNVMIFGAKLWVHNLSGSSSMLAEAMHSVADVLNQMLLRIGLLKARKGPTEMHPYGYARDRFIWSLISAVGIFFLGAGASFIHGLHTLMDQRQLEHVGWSYAVLGVSMVLEGYSLWVATRVVLRGAQSRRMGLVQYIKSGADPTTVAVMMEDGGAVLGLAIAGACTALAHATGNAMWDAAGSILVGCLLGAIATFLVQKNRQLLIGRSMAPADVAAVQSLLQRDPVVSYVTDTKTEEIGAGMYRFKAEVAWDGDKVVERYLDRCGREQLIGRLQAAGARGDPAALEALVRTYGRDLISAVGAEVDRIENEIQKLNPGILYVDLETDRGRHESWRRGAKALGIDGGCGSGGSVEAAAAGGSAGPAGNSIDGWWGDEEGAVGERGEPGAGSSDSGSGSGSGGGQQQQQQQLHGYTCSIVAEVGDTAAAATTTTTAAGPQRDEGGAAATVTRAAAPPAAGGGGGGGGGAAAAGGGAAAGGLELDLSKDRWAAAEDGDVGGQGRKDKGAEPSEGGFGGPSEGTPWGPSHKQ